MKHLIEILSTDKIISAAIFMIAIFCQEFIKELVHSLKVSVGFKSNISLALYKDKKIDDSIRTFVSCHDEIASIVMVKITNGGGIPKEGSPLNSAITHPIEKRMEWTLTEVSKFFRGIIQQVYNEKRLLLPIEVIPIGDPTYSYLKSQKEMIECIEMIMVKEQRKCRYILDVRLLCTPEEFLKDNRLREDIRNEVSRLRKYIG